MAGERAEEIFCTQPVVHGRTRCLNFVWRRSDSLSLSGVCVQKRAFLHEIFTHARERLKTQWMMLLTEHFNLHVAGMGLIVLIECQARVKALVMQFVSTFDHQSAIGEHTLPAVIWQFVPI